MTLMKSLPYPENHLRTVFQNPKPGAPTQLVSYTPSSLMKIYAPSWKWPFASLLGDTEMEIGSASWRSPLRSGSCNARLSPACRAPAPSPSWDGGKVQTKSGHARRAESGIGSSPSMPVRSPSASSGRHQGPRGQAGFWLSPGPKALLAVTSVHSHAPSSACTPTFSHRCHSTSLQWEGSRHPELHPPCSRWWLGAHSWGMYWGEGFQTLERGLGSSCRKDLGQGHWHSATGVCLARWSDVRGPLKGQPQVSLTTPAIAVGTRNGLLTHAGSMRFFPPINLESRPWKRESQSIRRRSGATTSLSAVQAGRASLQRNTKWGWEHEAPKGQRRGCDILDPTPGSPVLGCQMVSSVVLPSVNFPSFVDSTLIFCGWPYPHYCPLCHTGGSVT